MIFIMSMKKIYGKQLWLSRRTFILLAASVLLMITAVPVLASSLDNWHSRNSLLQGHEFSGITYGNGTFVAVGLEGEIFTSTDGATWTERTSGTTMPLFDVIYGNGIFVVVGGNDDGTILTSSDGVVWTKRTTAANIHDITYGNGIFVASGKTLRREGYLIFTSTDGATWTERTSGTTNFLGPAIYGNGIFMVMGSYGTIFKSSDGVNWTWDRVSGTIESFHDVTYGNSIFVVLGSNLGDGGIILTSSDGATWTERTSHTNHLFISVTYGNGTFVAVGTGGLIFTSTDGTIWTERNSGTISYLGDVTYGSGTFVVVGEELILQSDQLSTDTETINIQIDNKKVKFNSSTGYPFIDKNGRTQVPFRATLEAFGAEVSWDNQRGMACAKKNGTTVYVPINKDYILVNEQQVKNDTSAVIVDKRTYCPIRKVLEAFGATVAWDTNTLTVMVKSPTAMVETNLLSQNSGTNIIQINCGKAGISPEEAYLFSYKVYKLSALDDWKDAKQITPETRLSKYRDSNNFRVKEKGIYGITFTGKTVKGSIAVDTLPKVYLRDVLWTDDLFKKCVIRLEGTKVSEISKDTTGKIILVNQLRKDVESFTYKDWMNNIKHYENYENKLGREIMEEYNKYLWACHEKNVNNLERYYWSLTNEALFAAIENYEDHLGIRNEIDSIKNGTILEDADDLIADHVEDKVKGKVINAVLKKIRIGDISASDVKDATEIFDKLKITYDMVSNASNSVGNLFEAINAELQMNSVNSKIDKMYNDLNNKLRILGYTDQEITSVNAGTKILKNEDTLIHVSDFLGKTMTHYKDLSNSDFQNQPFAMSPPEMRECEYKDYTDDELFQYFPQQYVYKMLKQ